MFKRMEQLFHAARAVALWRRRHARTHAQSVCDASLDCVWEYVFSIESMCALRNRWTEQQHQDIKERTERHSKDRHQ